MSPDEEDPDYDSDGFRRSEDTFDVNDMTLEEKILSGYFTAKPYMNEKYVGSILNRPNLPRGIVYKY